MANTNSSNKTSEMKFDLKLVIFISLINMTTMMAWSLYNSNVNVSLNDILQSPAIVGFLMTVDNIIALILSPYIGSISDTTKSRFGRRMPYIMIGLPLAAIFFAIIPFVDTQLVPLLIVIFLFNISMAVFRPQTFALMPDFVPSKHRSKGNGVVNLFGGLGAVLAFGIGALFVVKQHGLAYILISVSMLVSLVIVFLKVKEPDTRNWDFSESQGESKISLVQSLKFIAKEEDKSTIFAMLTIFCAYSGYNAIESMWSNYAKNTLGYAEDVAIGSLTYVGIFVIIFSVIAGLIAGKISRKWSVLIGIIGAIPLLILCEFLNALRYINIAFALFGICWALINVNTITIIWELAPSSKQIGTYSGLYYFASMSAAILGPIFVGSFIEFVLGNTNYDGLFLVAVGFMILAGFFLLFVKRGESEITEAEKLAKKKAINKLS